MPTYNPNIPQPNDILSDSQDEILQNFQQINTVFGINHSTFETANQGKHNEVTLPENAAPTNTLINEANIYSRQSAFTGNTELVWQRENNGTRIEWTSFVGANNGWMRLPSGILVKWGTVLSVFPNPYTVVFPVNDSFGNPIPVFQTLVGPPTTSPFFVSVSANTASVQVGVCTIPGTLTNTQFQVNTFSTFTGGFSSCTVVWIAMGL